MTGPLRGGELRSVLCNKGAAKFIDAGAVDNHDGYGQVDNCDT